MEPIATPQSGKGPAGIEEDATMRRVLELSSRKHLTRFSLESYLATIPDDWKPGEADVDEFLNSIRGHDGKP